MRNLLDICELGIRVGRCKGAQVVLQRLGAEPFRCDDCKFEQTVPKLIAAYNETNSADIIDLLQTFGFESEATLLMEGDIKPTAHDQASCSYSRVSITMPCEDKGCPSWIPAKWASHCMNRFRTITNLHGGLTAEHLATAFTSNRRRVIDILASVRVEAREELLRDMVPDGEYVDGHPDWLRSLEKRFERPIENILVVITADQLVNGYSLQEDQRHYLNQIILE